MIFPFNAGEVFKIALKIEDNGHLFYQTLAARPFPEPIAKLFTDLAGEEMVHKGIFQSILNDLPPSTTVSTVWDPDNELDQYLKMMADEHVFNTSPQEVGKLVERVDSPAAAIRLAMGFERDTIVFFLELMAASEKYDDSRSQIKKLVDEERGHLAKLTRQLQAVLPQS